MTPQEILNGKDYESSYTQKFIQNLTDNLYFCEFDKNLFFFNPLDHHPNQQGYNHLFECVEKIMSKNLD